MVIMIMIIGHLKLCGCEKIFIADDCLLSVPSVGRQRWKNVIKIAQIQKSPKNISTKKFATKQRK